MRVALVGVLTLGCALGVAAGAVGCGDVDAAYQTFCERATTENPDGLSGDDTTCEEAEDCCPGFGCQDGECFRESCITEWSACGRDEDCCSGQCLDERCAPVDLALGLDEECRDATDCQGSLRCVEDRCQAQQAPGGLQPGVLCGGDHQCESLQCLPNFADLKGRCAYPSDCVKANESCLDQSDCCGVLRCGPSDRCIPPTWENEDEGACYPAGTACWPEDTCCNGECQGADFRCP